MPLLIAWLTLGLAFWISAFIEFYDHPFARPGIVELVIFLIASPLFVAQNLFDKYFK